jgi:hypothetical protein
MACSCVSCVLGFGDPERQKTINADSVELMSYANPSWYYHPKPRRTMQRQASSIPASIPPSAGPLFSDTVNPASLDLGSYQFNFDPSDSVRSLGTHDTLEDPNLGQAAQFYPRTQQSDLQGWQYPPAPE